MDGDRRQHREHAGADHPRGDTPPARRPAEANEPMLATDAHDATLPIDRTESWEQIERTEFSDRSDHTPAW